MGYYGTTAPASNLLDPMRRLKQTRNKLRVVTKAELCSVINTMQLLVDVLGPKWTGKGSNLTLAYQLHNAFHPIIYLYDADMRLCSQSKIKPIQRQSAAFCQ